MNIIVFGLLAISQISDLQAPSGHLQVSVLGSRIITERNNEKTVVSLNVLNDTGQNLSATLLYVSALDKDGNVLSTGQDRFSYLPFRRSKSLNVLLPINNEISRYSITTNRKDLKVVITSQSIEKKLSDQNSNNLDMAKTDKSNAAPYSIDDLIGKKINQIKGVTEIKDDTRDSVESLLYDTLLKINRNDPLTKIYNLDHRYFPSSLQETQQCELFVDSASGIIYKVFFFKGFGGDYAKLESDTFMSKFQKLLATKYIKLDDVQIDMDSESTFYSSADNKDLLIMLGKIETRSIRTLICYQLVSYSEKAKERRIKADKENDKKEKDRLKESAKDL